MFFKDAFTEGLRGERPASWRAGGAAGNSRAPAGSTEGTEVNPTEGTEVKWSERVSAVTLEDEIKAIHRRVAEALENPRDFQAQGHRLIRPSLSTAAVIFAVINQFDGQVRWKDDACAARDRFALASENARAGSAQVTHQVTERAHDLQDLIRGSQLAGESSMTELSWPEFADRQMLMQRLESGMEATLIPGVANTATLQQQRAALVHESELVAMIARVLVQPAMPDADDDQYRSWCEQLEDAALKLRQAAQSGEAAAAEGSLHQMRTQCAACHEMFRG